MNKASLARRPGLGKWVLLAALVLYPLAGLAPIAQAQVQNAQEGDNKSSTDQSGEGGSGDAVVGQVAGVVSGGNTSVDATNGTDRSSAESGDATADNTSTGLVGHNVTGTCGSTADCPFADTFSPQATNIQEGDNKSNVNQDATALSGSAVAGGVVGVVTSSGGSADLVLGNGTANSDAATGDAKFSNDSSVRAGLFVDHGACCPVPTDVFGPAASSSFGV
jgi:hypothetical protein